MTKFHIYLFSFFFVITAFSSCENDSKVNEDTVDELIEDEMSIDSALIRKGVQKNLDYVIENLHISDEMIKTLSSQSNLYNEQFLNDINKVPEYETSKSKAVNLGVFGAELNYIIHFGQTQSSFKYLIGSKQLADQIGVALAFDQKILDSYQANTNQKDSLINIVYTAYDNVRKYLRNGEQFQMASLVIAGSWVENMYITTSLLPSFQNVNRKSSVITSIVSQRKYVETIITLLESLNEEKEPFIEGITNDFKAIDSIYVKLSDKPVLDEKNVQEFNDKVSIIRTNLIQSR